jgi:hypothetical protein
VQFVCFFVFRFLDVVLGDDNRALRVMLCYFLVSQFVEQFSGLDGVFAELNETFPEFNDFV